MEKNQQVLFGKELTEALKPNLENYKVFTSQIAQGITSLDSLFFHFIEDLSENDSTQSLYEKAMAAILKNE